MAQGAAIGAGVGVGEGPVMSGDVGVQVVVRK